MKRRKSPGVPFFFPDWIHLQELCSDVVASLRSYGNGRLLDVGCGEKPFSGMSSSAVTDWIGFDVPANESADVHGFANDIPFPDGSFDTILCTQVLEHVSKPWDAVSEMARVLSAGGHAIITVPQYWEGHEQPFDFFRFTPQGISALLEEKGFSIVERRLQGRGLAVPLQALNLAIQHAYEDSRVGKHIIVRAAKVPLYAFNNLLFLTCRRVFSASPDCLNILVVAEKR